MTKNIWCAYCIIHFEVCMWDVHCVPWSGYLNYYIDDTIISHRLPFMLTTPKRTKTRCTWRVFIGSLLIFTPNCFPVKSFLSIKRKRSDKHHLILVWSWEFCDNSRNNLCTFNCMNEISYPIDGLSHNNLGWDIFTC